MSELVPALLQAARRSPNSLVELWDSPFLHAMAIVTNAGAMSSQYPAALSFLGSDYVDTQHLPSDSDPSAEYGVRTRTISTIVEILFAKLRESLADRPKSMSEDEIVDRILSPQENTTKIPVAPGATPTSTSSISAISPGKVIAALIYLPRPQSVPILTLIIRWLVRRTSPLGVIRATQGHIAAISFADMWPTILFFIASITGRVCLDAAAFRDHAALAELCIAALVKIAHLHQFHPRLPALVDTAVAALREVGTDGVATQMTQHLLIVRKFVEDDTWRWSTKQRLAVLAELECLESSVKTGPSPKAPGIESLQDGESESEALISMSPSSCAVDRGFGPQ
ncbi:hypothetical protein B0H17DRAFT_1327748 [Mycena rosella]|uniref:Uncharacterized protein n=1 Tax=Mycena rosella TaxID=1033263 RepID=A0AAD7DWA5_MYCRO|nr:hypothetical protein B0H17DRAFT_1327748 [Mycena rosella]